MQSRWFIILHTNKQRVNSFGLRQCHIESGMAAQTKMMKREREKEWKSEKNNQNKNREIIALSFDIEV